MSYDIYLKDPVINETIELNEPHFMRGATYKLDGDTKLYLNITYNYAEYYYKTIDKEKGIRKLYGITGLESIPILEKAINQLGNDVDEDYYEPTEGNAKRPLVQLLTMAKMCPYGIWDGD
jgi:hypothetical protein